MQLASKSIPSQTARRAVSFRENNRINILLKMSQCSNILSPAPFPSQPLYMLPQNFELRIERTKI